MNQQHKELAAGRWKQLSFFEQMANIGGEVERALNWKARQNHEYSQKAFERTLELIDLTIDSVTGMARFKELSRVREAIVDFFAGSNQFGSTEISWKRYFLPFTYAARRRY
ncbi:MAG: hypothetical protein HYR55_12335 [Acidobacteria bacterium]|nr:hypothetical protein [Acidobacteriota bacterium]MBI3656262.1 hypothetical protein [Acidobacteriota bacterium]